MRREGAPIQFLCSFFPPEDELCFCLYEARSPEEVAEAGRRAELVVGRIQQAFKLATSNNRPGCKTCGNEDLTKYDDKPGFEG